MTDELGIACIQLSPERGDPAGNLERSLAWIDHAADSGHELIVLPELAVSGYAFGGRAEAWESGEAVPDGPTCRAWRDAARRRRVWIVGGLAERAWGALYDTAVLIGPDGDVLSVYRKMHLWSSEHLWFEPGGSPSGVVGLPFGRVALAICFDLWVPELFRYYARAGADIVCMPSNWSSPPTVRGGDRPTVDHLAIATSHVNAIFIAAADRAGSDGDFSFVGASMVVNPRGEVVARAEIPAQAEELVSVRVDPMEARLRKTWSRFNRALDSGGALLADAENR
jgi:N-carbamoylputrescine amidase